MSIVFFCLCSEPWMSPARHIAATLILTIGFCLPAIRSECGDTDTLLPGTVKPFEKPIELRFRPVKHFTYVWTKHWKFGEAPERLIEGYAIEGAAKAKGNLLTWTYTLYNIGHDGQPREWGQVEAISDAWGKITEVKVLASKLPKVAPDMKPRSFAYLDEMNFEFPLCCLPQTPVKMGDDIIDWRREIESNLLADPSQEGPTSLSARSVATGTLTEGNRTYLVVEHSGGMTSGSDSGQGQMSMSGYWLFDIANGLKSRGVIRKMITVSGDGQGASIVSFERVHSEY